MNTKLHRSGSVNHLTDKLKQNAVSVIFIVIALVCFFASGMEFSYVLEQVLLRLAQNSFLVLALIIPVIAGMGLNFSITVGAMASQIALFLITLWSHKTGSALFAGIPGLLMALIITIPLSVLFGYLAGALLNHTKGQEMIAGMILGYFANGIYMFIFLILFGGLIKIDDTELIISGGVGVKNTFDISSAGALDDLFSTRLAVAVPLLACLFVLYCIGKFWSSRKQGRRSVLPYLPMVATTALLIAHAVLYSSDYAWVPVLRYAGLAIAVVTAVAALVTACLHKQKLSPAKVVLLALLLAASLALALLDQFTSGRTPLRTFLKIDVPLATYMVIGLVCLLNTFLFKTRIGQNLRTVGQNMAVATASGIHVNRIRIFAIVLSTVFAGIGQMIYIQSIGVIQTYSAHTNVALYSIAALLVGGASVSKANNKQALFGVLVFHTILVVLPSAVGRIFTDSQNTEYFRAFLLYSVICFSLISHVVSGRKQRARLEAGEEAEAAKNSGAES